MIFEQQLQARRMADSDSTLTTSRADASPLPKYDFINERFGVRVEVVIEMKVDVIATCFHYECSFCRFYVGSRAYNGDVVPINRLLLK